MRVVVMEEISQWLRDMLKNGHASSLKLITLFGGDRKSCCDEAVVYEEEGRIVGLATIAPNGEMESGQPTIVGIFVLPDYRGRGIGRRLLAETVQRCLDRGFPKVRIDCMSGALCQTIGALPEELRSALDVHSLGDFLDNIPG